jgi:NTP pyrophosphatase (non-canonical NTP hydrolase)
MNITLDQAPNMDDLTMKIRSWAIARNIHNAPPEKQFLKVIEEVGEVANAMAKGKTNELVDGIGDVYVTIVILAMQHGLMIEDCVAAAYREIAERKGKTVGGVFIKEEA